jgi:hypothetical protein
MQPFRGLLGWDLWQMPESLAKAGTFDKPSDSIDPKKRIKNESEPYHALRRSAPDGDRT